MDDDSDDFDVTEFVPMTPEQRERARAFILRPMPTAEELYRQGFEAGRRAAERRERRILEAILQPN